MGSVSCLWSLILPLPMSLKVGPKADEQSCMIMLYSTDYFSRFLVRAAGLIVKTGMYRRVVFSLS